jgi:hypothetical protein
LEPITVKDWDFDSDPDVALTATVEPGFVHGALRFSPVVAAPVPFVTADAGLIVAPLGPVNETDAPAVTAPDAFFSVDVTVTAPEAGTCMLGVLSMSSALDAAKAGVLAVRATAGTAHAAPARMWRRVSEGSVPFDGAEVG